MRRTTVGCIFLVCGGLAAAEEPGSAEQRLVALGLDLPAQEAPVANYVRAVRSGDLVFLAGHGPVRPEGGYVVGKVGRDLTVEEGQAAAELTALAMLATLKEEIGSLDRVRRVVKVNGSVNSTPDFIEPHKVMNGFSDLIVAVFGDLGRHARAAVCVASLPLGIPVEVEMIVEVE